ncbi:MAG: DUF5060 domain-containing protein [Lentisphaerae bacterium]|nr:DUF5060 domain-containing protein [Lentisphaerota bacterium]
MNPAMILPGVGLLVIGVLGACQGAPAPAWRDDPGGPVWQGRHLAVQLDPRGRILIRQDSLPLAELAFFHWHDAWVYERLDRGTLTAGPALGEDGVLRLSGLWGTTAPAPPLSYDLELRPQADGVEVVLTAGKTGDLRLTAGLWAVLTLPRDASAPAGRLVHAEPGPSAPIGRALDGHFRRLWVGTPGQAALCLTPRRLATARTRLAEHAQSMELTLRRQDFPLGETATVALRLHEAAMPTPAADPSMPSRAALALRGVAAQPEAVPLYGAVDLRVDLDASWDNPYDPDDIALAARVTTASGRQYDLPGFFMVPHRREVDDGIEIMTPAGPGEWHLRLAGTELGPLRCEVTVRDRSGEARLALPPMTVVPSEHPGFIRVSRVDPHYLAYDSGAPYLPIGHNLPIYPTAGQLVDEALGKMAAAGENWNRWWMSQRGLGLEWESRLGWYRQAQAAQLDTAMTLAQQLGFAYMLCFDTHQDFRQDGWKANPFNTAQGGPCATPAEWFTHPEARRHYRNRLRYTVARWAASSAVQCWEFGNEFEGWADTPHAVIIDWHREMAAHLRALDPYGHPITTSWWSTTGPETCWQIPEIDIVQTHCYTNNDRNVAEIVREFCLKQRRDFQKPHIFGEFGIRSHDTTADKDPHGWALHNAFWAAVASGCDGIPMPWWHENYIDPLNLYGHFTAIRRFTAGLPFGTAVWRPLEVTADYVDAPAEPPRRDAVLVPAAGFRRRAVDTFTLAPDGTVNDPQELLALLHGSGHGDLRRPPTFVVRYPSAGRFVIHVDRVSSHGHLRVHLDGATVVDRELPCGEGHGKSWLYRPQWQLWESSYDEEIAIDVPAGEHRIVVENLGKDWIRVGSYRFEGCRLLLKPNLLTAAMATDREAILWVQNRESTWSNHGRGAVPTVPAATVTLQGLPDGPVAIAWWETWEGREQSTATDVVRNGRLELRLPPLRTDLAVRLRLPPRP